LDLFLTIHLMNCLSFQLFLGVNDIYVIYILYYTPILTYGNNYFKKYANQEFFPIGGNLIIIL